MNTRLKRLKKLLQNTKNVFGEKVDAAILISTNPRHQITHDQLYPYRQNSDFFYLTGSNDLEQATLLLSTKEKRPILFTPKPDTLHALWEGAPPSLNPILKHTGAKSVVSDDLEKELLNAVKGHSVLYYQDHSETLSKKIAEKFFEMKSSFVRQIPSEFRCSNPLLTKLRLYKDRSEIKLIKQAARITKEALLGIEVLIRPGAYEYEIANHLEYLFKKEGAQVAFDTIVASGANAATLHYTKLSSKLKKGENLLIDCGARRSGYCADLTRCYPVTSYSPQQEEVIAIVQSAKDIAISAVRPGVSFQAVYLKAARELTVGLKELGVLSGSVDTLIEKRKFFPYFPHGIGHSLGVDVHDPDIRGADNSSRLEKGMVITIEPGLYFPKKSKGIPAMGVRLEDDVHVTGKGGVVL